MQESAGSTSVNMAASWSVTVMTDRQARDFVECAARMEPAHATFPHLVSPGS